MKKLVLFSLIMLCLFIDARSQYVANTPLEKTENWDQYILPDAIINGCCYSDSITYLEKRQYQGYFLLCTEVPGHDSEALIGPFSCKSDDVAQLFHTDTLLTICGVSFLLNSWHAYSPNVFKYLFGIGDTSFNIKRSGVVPENMQDIYWCTSYFPFVDIFFDSSINVFGDYSVVFDTPKPSQYAEYDNDFNMSQIMTDYITVLNTDYYNSVFYLSKIYGALKNTDCTPNKSFHKSAFFKYDRQTDITTISDTCGWAEVTDYYADDFYGFYMFPIFAETDSSLECIGCEAMTDTTDYSSLVNIVDNYTFIFPNPASKEVNVQCSFRMQTLELFNEQGQKVNEWKIDSYHYLLNIEDYPKGNYVMKIKTKSGTATKKVIVQ
jgi:hypothetical protein